MIDFSQLNIEFNPRGNEAIRQSLYTLYTTAEGSVPFDREFGIKIDFLDKPDAIAQVMLSQQYYEKTMVFEPSVTIEDIQFESDLNGTLTPKVVVSIDDTA